MSTDVAALKAQIKSWERDFKLNHGKHPSVQDIRDNPDIAAKYKLYKKYSKAPSIPQPRPVETTAPLSSFNPFSPTKNKGKQKEFSPIKKPSNLFATPSKVKPLPRLTQASPSPPPSPTPAPPKFASTSALEPLIDPPPTAVSRARKRLRGEPVSPSPNKEKRRRLESQTILPFARRNTELFGSDEEDDDEQANSSFVDDSPVKPSTAKSFHILFEETAGSKTLFTRSKSSSSSLFGTLSRRSAEVEDDLDAVLGNKSKAKRQKTLNGTVSRLHEGLAEPLATTGRQVKELSSGQRPTVKRSLSDSETEMGDEQERSEASEPGLVLVPPSPPSEPSSHYPPNDGKRRNNVRKKAKLGDDSDTDMQSGDEVKVVVKPQLRVDHAEDSDLGLDSEPILRYLRPLSSAASETRSDDDEGVFDVQLPDKLRDILALSSSEHKTYDAPEEQVVEELLYGRKTAHYDPSRGGEIWGVGDSEHARSNAEDEDDWEGEPVPWEIGEL